MNIAEIKRFIAKYPVTFATLAGAGLGGISEASNVYFGLDPSDIGQEEYDRLWKKNLVRGALVGGAGGLTAAHAYQRITSPSFKYASTMLHFKLASVDAPSAPAGSITSTALEKLKGSPLLKAVLASGLIGAGAGGVLTSMRPKQPGEDPSARRRRILRNAILTGLMAGGGVAALGAAGKNLQTTLPKDDRGDPVARTASGLLRVAPAAGVAGWNARSMLKGEDASARNLVGELVKREEVLRNETHNLGTAQHGGPRGQGFLASFFNDRAGAKKAPKQPMHFGKGPISVRDALQKLVKDPDTLGGRANLSDAAGPNQHQPAGMASPRSYLRQLMNENAGEGFPALGEKHLMDAGVNPAYLRDGAGTANPSLMRRAEGYADLWKDRWSRPGTGRLSGLTSAGVAGAGLFTPEILSALGLGAGKALDFANSAVDTVKN